MYWNTDFSRGPLHPIPNHISLCRFEQIKRYCHISCPESDERNGYHLPINKIWWYKLEPLASSIQAASHRYYSPSSDVSIDELIVQCYGRYGSCTLLPHYPANNLGLYIHIRCLRNQSSKGTKFTESWTMDIYTIGSGAPGRRDISIRSITRISPQLAVSYGTLPSPYLVDSSRYTLTTTSRLYNYFRNCEPVILVLLEQREHILGFPRS